MESVANPQEFGSTLKAGLLRNAQRKIIGSMGWEICEATKLLEILHNID